MDNLQHGIEGLTEITPEEMKASMSEGLDIDALTQAGFSVRTQEVPVAEFETYLQEIDYDTAYPSYVSSFSKAYVGSGKDASGVNRKYFEQFLSIYLTTPGPDHVTVDIAAANGPFSSILATHCNVAKSYHQDLNPPNRRVHEYLGRDAIVPIQCNAGELPFEDGSIDRMYLLNSWEHFQAPSDVDFLIEAERCLAPDGQVMIVPLNATRQAFVQTDPDLWDNKQIYEKGQQPMFRQNVPVHVRKCGQVYAQNHDAEMLIDFARRTPGLAYEVVQVSLDDPRAWFPTNSWNILIATKR